jgi:hypothetical protein
MPYASLMRQETGRRRHILLQLAHKMPMSKLAGNIN